MCGICGIINFGHRMVLESEIRLMMKIMKHRGPDDEGVFIDKNIGLGFVRLSIIDLSPAGHQPMYSADRRYIIVFNGEIYNYPELRAELEALGYQFNTKTDTEVLLTSYIHWGESCLDHFNGMWAFVIYDTQSGIIFAARDRFGVKPFYYMLTDDFFAFASEIPPLLQLLPGKPAVDYQSIYDYLVFNRTDHTEKTFFSQVKKLQHGHCLSLPVCYPPLGPKTLTTEGSSGGQGGSSSIGQGDSSPWGEGGKLQRGGVIKKWYDLPSRVSLSQGFSDPSEFRELLRSSIGLRLRSDVPVGVCFSGGLDSSSIVSILLNESDIKELKTFSAVYPKGMHGDESSYIDEIRSDSLIKNFVTPSSETLSSDLDSFVRAHAEPIPGTSPYAQFKVMELAKGKVVVTLDGQGADEELAGYHYFFGFYFSQLLRQFRLLKFFKEFLYYLKNHKSLYGIKSLFYLLLPPSLKNAVQIRARSYLFRDFIRQFSDNDVIVKDFQGSKSLSEALLDHFEYKLEHLLKWEDRNSMWYSIEARVPFLDYRLVERTLATGTELILNKGTTKVILRDSMKNILPEKIRSRKDKMGFETPQAEWFRTPEWRIFIINLLNSPSFRNRNIINPDKAISQYNAHFNGKKNISKEIWKWINLELWFRDFID